MKLIFLVMTIVGSSLVHAQGNGGGGTNVPACKAPFAACQSAGYKVGAHKKGDQEGADKGLWVDCIDAVADGKKQVPGVNVSDAQACKAAIKGRK